MATAVCVIGEPRRTENMPLEYEHMTSQGGDRDG